MKHLKHLDSIILSLGFKPTEKGRVGTEYILGGIGLYLFRSSNDLEMFIYDHGQQSPSSVIFFDYEPEEHTDEYIARWFKDSLFELQLLEVG